MPSACRFFNSEDVKPTGVHPVAAGGFADIWEAMHAGRKVVLKSYRCHVTSDVAQVVERFYNEVRVCGLLRHRDVNAVPSIGVYSTETHPFALVYEFMDGLDLKQYLRNEPNARRLELLTDVAQSLRRMHNLGIVHGSLQVAHVLVDKDGAAHISGLGNAYILPHSTAWAAEGGMGADRLGPGLAPDVTDSTQPAEASDVYAFGVMAFEILTGHPPFFELTGIAARYSMLKGNRPPRPSRQEISDRLWYMVERCWHAVPTQRISIGELVDLLETELRHLSNPQALSCD
ncbi:kinase-like domain-containing protein [Thelephora terrestris]|uniref:Kinase-like domain-containing protein n=1 Tax=Thelephora terrestris TaxID=56493 RepID=A0A9P6H4T5_9AGAM|nr:kinase-like domain-containing protein [Thelephora terrestris]